MKDMFKIALAVAVIIALLLLGYNNMSYKGRKLMDKTQAQKIPDDPNKYQKATFAAGCFWHVQYDFDQIPGVISTTAGFTGGVTENPTYKQVCTDKTGHAEAVEIIYDPNKVNYNKLLDVFFVNHNPTTKNRQGPDVGTQYRSAVFYHNAEQQKAALAKIDELSKSGKFSSPIVTEVRSAGPFYKAEDYHQKYLEKRGIQPCPAF
jgi:peptide-methionine (S)-S-oxide reductase